MQKIRDNIVKLSYTTKTIGVKDEEIGIFSKRLPLKYKNPHSKTLSKPKPEVHLNSKFIPHKSFYSSPLVTVRKNATQTPDETPRSYEPDHLQITNQNTHYSSSRNFKPTTQLQGRTHSMARLRVYKN